MYQCDGFRLYFRAVGEPKVRVRQHLPMRWGGGLGLLALRSSGSRGSDSPPDCHSLPLPFESALPRTKKHGMPEWTFRVFWQGRKDSNPRPMVLETSTLPTELHPYAPVYYTKLFSICQELLQKNIFLAVF